jgi:hypothetical protein
VAAYDKSISYVTDDQTFYVHNKLVKYAKMSLGMLDTKNKIRWIFVWFANWKYFENTVLSLIIINSILLGIKDYTDPNDETSRNKFILLLEPVFTYSFLIECVVKIIA